MTSRSFEGCWHRVDRAAVHRESALSEWNTFIHDDPDPFDFRLNGDGKGNFTLTVFQEWPIPPIIGIRLGEWLYNLRSALDNCVFDVAVCDSGQHPPPGPDLLQFPIYRTADQFRKNAYRIKPLTDKHRQWLEDVQPYETRCVPEHTAIYWVNELARIDRHRSLHVLGAYIAESNPVVEAPNATGVFWEEVPFSPFIEGDTVIARFSVEPFSAEDEVHANPQTAIDPEIAEWAMPKWDRGGLDGFPFSMRLWLMENYVKITIGRFERDCVGHTRPDVAKSLKAESAE